MKFALATGLLAAASAALLSLQQPAEDKQERLARHINLGKAFYENPGAAKEAVEQFRQALALNPNSAREHLNYGLALVRVGQTKEGVAELEKARSLNPSLPQPYFNLGVVFKKEGDFARAMTEFTEMARRVPDEPVTHYQLGTLYRLEGQTDRALAEFETAARLEPTMAAPHFQLFNTYRLAKRTVDAQRELAVFNEIKKRQTDLGLAEDVDWSYYSEILEIITPATRDGAPTVEVVFEPQRLGTLGGTGFGLIPLDADGDGRLDLLGWSSERITLFRNSAKGFTAASVAGGATSVSAGDFNNDGLPDLCAGALLITNQKGQFRAAEKPLLAGSFRKCVWVDYDHDYDLDLLLLGATPALMRNNGDGSWTAVTSSFPFAAGDAIDAAVLEVGENNGFDIVVAYQNGPAVLYRDRKEGQYEAAPLPFRLTAGITVGDFNHDGFLDLAAGSQFVENQRGSLKPGPGLPKPATLFADFQNRGRLDLLAGGEMLLHRGGLTFEPGKVRGAPVPWQAGAAGDFNNDGLTDAAVITADGAVQLLRNVTPVKHPWLRVALAGVKNLKLAPGARVEVKAGRLYQKRVYQGIPLLFGLPGYARADVVRIIWPNGLIQNEPRQAASASYNYKEAQRLSGSCPMIFTWNGERFEFISDVLAVAPLGVFFPLDHDEYVQIPGRSLRPRDGMYEVRITEELREVSYLDQIKLIAVDHPAGVEISTSDKFKSTPFPEFRLYGVRQRIYPTRAVDHRGRDVLDGILRRDRRYPDGFARDLSGRAEAHSLTLEFPKSAPVLYLHGWVDWADGSTFVAASQGPEVLRGPSLQVEDAHGRWVTAMEDMGMPAGKPKTIAVELGGIAARRLRIVTNMCVYWDEIFLGEDAAEPEARLTPLLPESADLRFRGFSAVTVHPQRRQPEIFDYARVRPAAMWNPTPGFYTRYGDTRELLESIDDRFVIMGSGDELRLLFRAGGLPPLTAGWTRDFLLFVDGWAKDADPNTVTGSTVEPLPFHAMRNYPDSETLYPAAGDERARPTRPALRLIRPLPWVVKFEHPALTP